MKQDENKIKKSYKTLNREKTFVQFSCQYRCQFKARRRCQTKSGWRSFHLGGRNHHLRLFWKLTSGSRISFQATNDIFCTSFSPVTIKWSKTNIGVLLQWYGKYVFSLIKGRFSPNLQCAPLQILREFWIWKKEQGPDQIFHFSCSLLLLLFYFFFFFACCWRFTYLAGVPCNGQILA